MITILVGLRNIRTKFAANICQQFERSQKCDIANTEMNMFVTLLPKSSLAYSNDSMASIAQVGWLCLTCYRQQGHLETASPFTVPCKGHEARLIHRESSPGLLRGSPLHNRCATQAPDPQMASNLRNPTLMHI